MTDSADAGLWGLSWQTIRRVVVSAWIVFFISCWVFLYATWADNKSNTFSLTIIIVSIVFACTLVPGMAVLLYQKTRERLLTLPEAAALSAISLSFITVMLGAALISVVVHGEAAFTTFSRNGYPTLESLASSLLVGMIAFPSLFGLAFPLGIPLVCACVVWSKINQQGSISRAVWITAVAVSFLGWLLVLCIGDILGNA